MISLKSFSQPADPRLGEDVLNWLGRLAVLLHRRPEDTRMLSGKVNVLGKLCLLAVVLVPLSALVVVFFRQAADFTRASHPEVVIPRDGWRVLYRTQTPEEHCRLVPPQMPGTPAA